jgi:asparagine synthase (glutamine-hydrolysing)
VPGFRVALDPAALPAYLQFGYVPAPGTIFEGVRKLRPGHWLELGKDGAVREEPYWDLESRILARRATWAGGRAPGEEALVEELEALLVDAFRYRLVSDVPVGIMLSGGIDSSTVAAILRRKVGADLKTFTVAFDEKAYDESPAARAVAEHLGADHHQLSCSSREALEVIPKLPEIYDEPFGDNSAVPTYLLSRLTRQHVTVALSADGGDEIFCGYAHYPAVSRFARILRWLPRPAVPLVRGALGLISPDALEAVLGRFPRLTNGARVRARYSKLRRALGADGPDRIFEISRSCWFPDEVDRLLGRSPGAGESHLLRILKTIDGDPMQRMMVADSRTYLPDDILVKVDRATMAVSLEAREPFLDHRLVEFAMSLPIGFRYRKGRTKYILRKVLSRHVPAGLVDRPKHGFSMPVWDWFRKDLTNLYREYLGPARLARSGIFDVREVDRELTSYLEGRSIRGEHLWLILVFEMWRERWLGAH